MPVTISSAWSFVYILFIFHSGYRVTTVGQYLNTFKYLKNYLQILLSLGMYLNSFQLYLNIFKVFKYVILPNFNKFLLIE